MPHRALKLADGISAGALAASMALAAAMFAVMLLEVFARYVFGTPLVWSFEMTGMLNGCMFLFAAGPALKAGQHVAVDALLGYMPQRLKHAIMALFLLLFLPAIGWIEAAVIARAWSAFVTGEVDAVSPWRHVLWPYYAAVALALFTFLVQIAAETARHSLAALGTAQAHHG